MFFHGALFKGIKHIDRLTDDCIQGVVKGRNPILLLDKIRLGRWIFDPIMLDSAMQLAAIWIDHHLDLRMLPTGFEKMTLYQDLDQRIFSVMVQFPERVDPRDIHCDLFVFDEDRNLFCVIERLACIGTQISPVDK